MVRWRGSGVAWGQCVMVKLVWLMKAGWRVGRGVWGTTRNGGAENEGVGDRVWGDKAWGQGVEDKVWGQCVGNNA